MGEPRGEVNWNRRPDYSTTGLEKRLFRLRIRRTFDGVHDDGGVFRGVAFIIHRVDNGVPGIADNTVHVFEFDGNCLSFR